MASKKKNRGRPKENEINRTFSITISTKKLSDNLDNEIIKEIQEGNKTSISKIINKRLTRDYDKNP